MYFWANFLKLSKKRIALICFIEITSILAHMQKRSLIRRENPIHLMLKENASYFLLWDFKNKVLQPAHS